jgi:Pvc16 N-terminal domain
MSSSFAIAAVTAVLQYYLREVLGSFPDQAPTVSAVAPDIIQQKIDQANVSSQVNLFLHQVTYNSGWRNQYLPSLAADGKTRLENPPLALDLHYLLTVYASEDYHAEALMGIALLMLHQNPVLTRADITNAFGKLDPTNKLAGSVRDSALAQQIEQIKIVPATLGREEMAWLWTALKADYRPTFPFQASVLLLQPQLPASSGPPVLTRTVVAQANFLAPFPHLIEVDAPPGQFAATLGDTVTVKGTQLSGTQSVSLNSALQNVQQMLAIVAPGPNSFQFTVPSPPPPPPDTDPTDLPAGVYVVSATVKTASDSLTTNSVPMTIAPKITSPFPLSILAGANFTLTVTCAPFVRPSQQVSLLIGGQQATADTFSKATNTPSFTFRPLLPTSGSVPVWLRVDGIDSQIIDTSGPTPKYSGPLTQVTT